ncbi:hypothetical protein AB0E59_05890 [Lentzea sp. NPDC034063]|uniref:NACHT domain-containing protein n=1 Tax=unclassified Lentzea TaxID=2643253 RepID=UPI0033ED6EE6
MSREPALTFDGAIRILGAEEPKAVERLSKALGGGILLAGVAAGVATIGPAALAPLALFEPIWGWVDQKNEAIGLLRSLMGKFGSRMKNVPTRSRRQLVIAAHTTIVVAAYFDALRGVLGNEISLRVDLSTKEKLRLAGLHEDENSDFFQQIYRSPVPYPSPAKGYQENLAEVHAWLGRLSTNVERFLDGLAGSPGQWVQVSDVVEDALDRYENYYVKLAHSAPEMLIGIYLDEHAATRESIAESTHQIVELFSRQEANFGRVTSLLSLVLNNRSDSGRSTPVRAALSNANDGRLTRSILTSTEAAGYGHLQLPSVGESFVPPDYKVVCTTAASRIADEHWWSKLARQENLDLWFPAFVTSADAARPLLLLGHPGAGKSMLMKILAAKLPAVDYTCILVPLRGVSANAPVLAQVEQALAQSTNGRVSWPGLVDEPADTVQVVILDGLDELLQASNTDRSGYLQEVAEFQRVEQEQGRPLVVIVTSRTVVADRVEVAPKTTVLKLEDFREKQTAEWLRVWNHANADEITNGRVREVTLDVALSQPVLARQPLLLLMLAIYSSDQAAPVIDEGVSATTLYRMLFQTFARREVTKSDSLSADQVDAASRDQIERLSVVALGMFNRGGQAISEKELDADLSVLLLRSQPPGGAEEPGQRVLAEFFFMHTAEAVLVGSKIAGQVKASRTYEFMHATFGEFLVAQRTLEELREIADQSFGGKRRREPDDSLLFALLSHQVLAVRTSTLIFLRELMEELDPAERAQILTLLEELVQRFRSRSEGDGTYDRYRPIPLDRVRQLSCYSANLVSIRLSASSDEQVALTTLFGDCESPFSEWQSVVDLWRAGVDADGWLALVGPLSVDPEEYAVTWSRVSAVDVLPSHGDYLRAHLVRDVDNFRRLRYGFALHDALEMEEPEDWIGGALATIYLTLFGRDTMRLDRYSVDDVPDDLEPGDEDNLVQAICQLLHTRQANLELTEKLIKTLVKLGRLDEADPFGLFVSVCRLPELLLSVPELADQALYEGSRATLALLGSTVKPIAIRHVGNELDERNADLRKRGSDALLSLTREFSLEVGLDGWIANAPAEVLEMVGDAVIVVRDDKWDRVDRRSMDRKSRDRR